MELESSREEKRVEHFRETMDRLTTASHVQVDYFAEHKKIEGYYEENVSGQFFNCDRLMKQDNMFGTIQLGYNPNRETVFLFANMKTSRYDTVASHYQKELQDYRKRAQRKGENVNRAYVSKRKEMAVVLIEKRENKPWSQRSIGTYLKHSNMEAVLKTMPFLTKNEEKEELEAIKRERKQIQEEIREIRMEMASEKGTTEEKQSMEQETQIRNLRGDAVQNLTMENLLEAILIRKDAMGKGFLRRLNYAYDVQKKDIEAYYREKKKAMKETSEHGDAEDNPEDEDS
ncbi:MAG: hypothetical protein J6A94_12610 [Lachnospiraceae bacterium]|nr:hypothetical protein [Lachnospiraceae bacterium]